MKDQDMLNILANLDGVESGTTTTADGQKKPNAAAQEKDAMKTLLEGLDAQQRSVNQMPGTHKMGKNTKSKHPASKYLVGGEYEDEEELDDPSNPFNNWDENEARADDFMSAEDDIDEDKIADRKPEEDIHKKQSLSDIFKSMDEAEAERRDRLAREFHDKLKSKAKEPKKTDDGKYQLEDELTEEKEYYIVDVKDNIQAGPFSSHKQAKADLKDYPDCEIKTITNEGSNKGNDGYYYIQAGIDRHPEKFTSLKAAVRKGNQLFGHYRVRRLRVKHKMPGEKAETVKTLALEGRNPNAQSLNEDVSDAIFDLQQVVKNLGYFTQTDNVVRDEFKTNNGDTYIKLAKRLVDAVKHVRKQIDNEQKGKI